VCQFISWIEYKDQIYFLTNADLLTKEGKALKKYLGDQYKEDIKGHGAIRRYFELPDNKGTNKECTNFSKPENFPPVIVAAIKNGSLSAICDRPPVIILTKPARAEYGKIVKPARAEYDKIVNAARAEYDKIVKPARAEYDKIVNAARAEYGKIVKPAWAEYGKIVNAAFWKLAVNPRNRIKEWR